MRLADFIVRDMEAIRVQWEAFASTRVNARGMDSMALRDHAEQMLLAVVQDLRTAQTAEQQAEKSKGRAPASHGPSETAAQIHAMLRARSGFDIVELASEYRALRASVLHLWTDECAGQTLHQDDLVHFNEAIDQSLAESIAHFTAQVERSRNLLLGMLGHDMRSPLQTIVATASYLSALNAGAEVSNAASRLINSGRQTKALLEDLLDFNRSQLGLGIIVRPKPVDLARLFADELDRIRAAHSDRDLQLETRGDCRGE